MKTKNIIFLIILLSILISGAFFADYRAAVKREEIESQNEQIVKLAVMDVKNESKRLENLSYLISRLPVVSEALKTNKSFEVLQSSEYLKEAGLLFAIDECYLLNSYGLAVVDSSKNDNSVLYKSYADSPYYRFPGEGRTESYFVNDPLGNYYNCANCLVIDEKGETSGILVLKTKTRNPNEALPLFSNETVIQEFVFWIAFTILICVIFSVVYLSVSSKNRFSAIAKQKEKEREEALTLARIKSDFLAAVSHDIRTPLNGIIGMTDLLHGTKLSKEQKDYCDTIKSSGDTLIDIVDNILKFSKSEAGQISLDNLPFNLKEVIEQSVDSVGILAKNKGLNLVWRVDADVKQDLIGDEGYLKQIILNIVGNAIKFTNKGEVEMVVSNESGAEVDECILHFKVRDTGIGVDESQKESIFNPFVQGSSSNAHGRGGTGLGLTIAKRFVEMMGGRIWIESPAGNIAKVGEGPGSIFHFTVKLKVNKVAAAKGPSEEKQPAESGKEEKDLPHKLKDVVKNIVSEIKIFNPNKSLRILLAEDNQINQKVFSLMLGKKGHNVNIAENGKQAIERLKDNEYDVIFMDVQMPEMDGYEATRRIREIEKEKGGHIPIIAVTACVLRDDRQKCIDSGMDDYVSKPIRSEELFKAIERVFKILNPNKEILK